MVRLSRNEKTLVVAWAVAIAICGGLSAWVILGGPPSVDVDAVGPEPTADTSAAETAPLETAQPDQQKAAEVEAPTAAGPETAEPAADTLAGAQEIEPAATQDLALMPVDPALIENTEEGALPRIAADGRTPWQVYAGRASGSGEAQVAIVVTGLGLGRAATEAAIERLPAAVTLAFSPYGRDLDATTARARAMGHEILLMVPMEPLRYPDNDPGPQTLLRDAPPAQNLARLRIVMARLQGYVGIVNDMGSSFTASEDAMRPVLAEVKDRGLIFFDARSTTYSVVESLAVSMAIPVARNNRFLDEPPTATEIRRNLDELAFTARGLGVAVGLARPLPVSIETIAAWAADLGDMNVDLVPVSAVANGSAVR